MAHTLSGKYSPVVAIVVVVVVAVVVVLAVVGDVVVVVGQNLHWALVVFAGCSVGGGGSHMSTGVVGG